MLSYNLAPVHLGVWRVVVKSHGAREIVCLKRIMADISHSACSLLML